MQTGDRQRIVCPACGGETSPWRLVPSSDPAISRQLYELRRCLACGSAVTIGEVPSEVHDTGSYGGGDPRLYRLAEPVLKAFDRQRLSLLQPLTPPRSRLLDAGAGRGRFVASALAAGFDASGIEPSLRGSSAASATGAPVARATIEETRIEPDSLDAITAWHVLEHLDEPARAASQFASWLRPGGALLVGAPNLSSLQARLGGPRWYHLDVPRHRVHFTERGLRALLGANGFEVVRTTHLLAEHNPFGMWQSLLSRVTRNPSYLYNLLKRNASPYSTDLAVTMLAVPLAPLAALLELVAGMSHRGGTVAVLAKRGE